MCRFLNSSDEGGYSLLESMFHLLIMAIFIQFFLLFFFWKGPIERQYADYTSTEWELFAVDMQSVLSDVTAIDDPLDGSSLRLWKGTDSIIIEQRSSTIRKRVKENGHIPLFTNVKEVTFSLDGSTLTTDVLMVDGTRKGRSFVVGLYPE
ncbi:competence type IV pilus minor pilin ComGF [Filibacter tadaridae]|uniref:Competence protein ComGF n=1 Tax=Filibacter tadaridae TaxID=2483811 RepID=A0A3P5XCN1_9BACL|nr:competence type IV pilus minor pilin ComGF [Filibacter tadaridae]VDC32421.1 hypothetical protein FILTAD_02649 [Filibacter tadaridae]